MPQTKKLIINQEVEIIAGVAKEANLTSVFTIRRFFPLAWTKLASVIMAPAFFAASLIESILAWRDAYLDRKKGKAKKILIAKASIYTVSTIAIGVSFFGTFVASIGSTLVAPFLFTAAYALKSLFHFGCAMYYGSKLLFANKTEKPALKEKALTNLGLGVASVAVTIALGFAGFLSKATLGIIGIIGGVASIACLVYKVATIKKSAPANKVEVNPTIPFTPKEDPTPQNFDIQKQNTTFDFSTKFITTAIVSPTKEKSKDDPIVGSFASLQTNSTLPVDPTDTQSLVSVDLNKTPVIGGDRKKSTHLRSPLRTVSRFPSAETPSRKSSYSVDKPAPTEELCAGEPISNSITDMTAEQTMINGVAIMPTL